MRVILFVGFLGSGKTSLMLPLARYLVERREGGDGRTPVVIIENEVGDVSVDDAVLRREGLPVRELFGGCICCQLTADLTSCINDIHAEIDPHWVLIEATGLGTPQPIVSTIDRYGKGVERVTTLAVIDAERWSELIVVVEPLVTKQVTGADVVAVNKTDLVDADTLEEVARGVAALNERAKVVRLSAGKGFGQEIWEKVIGP